VVERDCNTCKHHVQGWYGIPPLACIGCIEDKTLPGWEEGNPMTPREKYLAAIRERHPGEIIEVTHLVKDAVNTLAVNQSRKESLLEASLDTLSGSVLSYLVWMLVAAPLFNIPVNHTDTFWITVLFTGVSLVRSYVWRRLFNNNFGRAT